MLTTKFSDANAELAQLFQDWEKKTADLGASKQAFDAYIEHFRKHDTSFDEVCKTISELSPEVDQLKEEATKVARVNKMSFSTPDHTLTYSEPKKVEILAERLIELQPELEEFPGLLQRTVSADVAIFDSLVKLSRISKEVAAEVRREIPLYKEGRVSISAAKRSPK